MADTSLASDAHVAKPADVPTCCRRVITAIEPGSFLLLEKAVRETSLLFTQEPLNLLAKEGGAVLTQKIPFKNLPLSDMDLKGAEAIEIFASIAEHIHKFHTLGYLHGAIRLHEISISPSGQTFVPVPLFLPDLLGKDLPPDFDQRMWSAIPPEGLGFSSFHSPASVDSYQIALAFLKFLTKNEIFPGTDPVDIADLIVRKTAVPWTSLNNIPPNLAQILDKCLRKSPKNRYTSCLSLAKELRFSSKHSGYLALGRWEPKRELKPICQLTGRQQELARLMTFLENANQGKATWVAIGAESGIGKTRLVEELLLQSKDLGWWQGRCKFSKFETNLPLSGLSRVINQVCGYLNSPPFQSQWHELLIKNLGPNGNLLIDRFPQPPGTWPVFPDLGLLGREAEEQAFFLAAAQFFLAAGQINPIVIFIDDLQWADIVSLRVPGCFASLALTSSSNAFVMGAYRTEEVGSDHQLKKFVFPFTLAPANIKLPTFSTENVKAMVSSLLDDPDPPANLAPFIYPLSQGRPFLVIEVIRALVDQNLLSWDHESWIFHEDAARNASLGQIADTFITFRLAQGSDDAQYLAEIASIIGQSFSFDRLFEVQADLQVSKEKQGFEPHRFALAIQHLLDLSIITANGFGYQFAHDRIREGIRSRIHPSMRVLYHAGYAKILLKQAGDLEKLDPSDQFEIAFHILQSNDNVSHDLAMPALYQAGRTALNVFAYSRAADFLAAARGLSSHSSPDQQLRILEPLAEAQTATGSIREAIATLDKALSLPKATSEQASHFVDARLLAKKSLNFLYLFDYHASIKAAELGLQRLGVWVIPNDRVALGVIFLVSPILAVAYFVSKALPKSRRWKANAEKMDQWDLLLAYAVPVYFVHPLRTLGNLLLLSFSFLRQPWSLQKATLCTYWGVMLSSLGLHRSAERCFHRTQHYLDQHPNPMLEIFSTMCWGNLLDFPRAELPKASSKLESAVRLAEQIGERFWKTISYQALQQIELLGVWRQKSDLHLMALDEAIQGGGLGYTLYSTAVMKYYFTNHKRLEEMTENVRRGVNELLEEKYESIDVIYGQLALAELAIWRHRSDALELAERAFSMHWRHQQRVSVCNLAPNILAQAMHQNHIRLRRLRPLAAAWIVQALGVRSFLPHTLADTGEFLFSIGIKRTGRSLLRKAIAVADKQQRKPISAQLMWHLSQLYNNERDRSVWARLAAEEFIAMGWRKFEGLDKRIQDSNRLEIRNAIDLKATLTMIAQMSNLSNRRAMAEKILEAFSLCSGAEVAYFIWASPDGRHKVGAILGDILQDDVPAADFDEIDEKRLSLPAKKDDNLKPVIATGDGTTSPRSTLVIPLYMHDVILAWIYLCNNSLEDVFSSFPSGFLSGMALQAEVALRNLAYTDEREQAATLKAEMAVARIAQSSFMPACALPPEVAVSYYYQPADKTGGDWLGYFWPEKSPFVIAGIADVTGHGIGSAMMTGVISGAFYSSEVFCNLGFKDSLAALIDPMLLFGHRLGHYIGEIGVKSNKAASMVLICLDLRVGQALILNYGHPAPIHLGHGDPVSIPGRGSPLGLSWKTAPCRPHILDLKPMQSIFTYTDGLVENPGGMQNRPLSQRGLIRNLQAIGSAEPDIVKSRLAASMETFWQAKKAEDDVAYLTLCWKCPLRSSL